MREFLAAHAPFDELPQAELQRLVGEIRIEYFRRGTTLIARGAGNHHLYVLRSGAADLRDQDGELVERSDAGATFGSITLTQGNPSTFEVVAIEDSLAYLLPAETFYRLVRDHPVVARSFSDQRAARMRPAVDALSSPTTGDAVLRIRVADWCATASTTIRDAAAIMAAQGVSALLIVDGDRLAGIITDRDLRSRVLAAGLEPTRPVSEVMTPDPITASPDVLAFEAMLAMVGRAMHHLPLVADGRPVGIVTSTDLLRLEHANPVYLVGDVANRRTSRAWPRCAVACPVSWSGWSARTRRPTAEATVSASISCDMRPVAGDAPLHARLTAHVRERTPTAQVFLLHLAKSDRQMMVRGGRR